MRELRSSGQTKVQRTLNRSEAEFGEANVPERLVYEPFQWLIYIVGTSIYLLSISLT